MTFGDSHNDVAMINSRTGPVSCDRHRISNIGGDERRRPTATVEGQRITVEVLVPIIDPRLKPEAKD
ncbi:hypothetical protein BaRGS_00007481 [Batillaria attramentaria]|uniref:Uncharacterized protein n=1 Tax=Batillaria attramentaria TaxID=370345 RepID=A0ABD0LPF2_9CAEN